MTDIDKIQKWYASSFNESNDANAYMVPDEYTAQLESGKYEHVRQSNKLVKDIFKTLDTIDATSKTRLETLKSTVQALYDLRKKVNKTVSEKVQEGFASLKKAYMLRKSSDDVFNEDAKTKANETRRKAIQLMKRVIIRNYNFRLEIEQVRTQSHFHGLTPAQFILYVISTRPGFGSAKDFNELVVEDARTRSGVDSALSFMCLRDFLHRIVEMWCEKRAKLDITQPQTNALLRYVQNIVDGLIYMRGSQGFVPYSQALDVLYFDSVFLSEAKAKKIPRNTYGQYYVVDKNDMKADERDDDEYDMASIQIFGGDSFICFRSELQPLNEMDEN